MEITDDDDKNQTLRQLSESRGASVVSQLVGIAQKANQQEHHKLLSFITGLECLQRQHLGFSRISINSLSQHKYVALSYTWQASDDESKVTGRYPVQNWKRDESPPSTVRDCVWDRVIKYMKEHLVKYLWIDAHCIRQPNCELDNCTRHSVCVKQRDAVQVMDLVYQLSDHPVALLTRRIHTGPELDLLQKILSRCLVTGDSDFRLSSTSASAKRQAKEGLRLLHRLLTDPWCERAWTFQENYRAGSRMHLLIPHDSSLEPQKQRHSNLFGSIPGELCILSVGLSTEATRLCLALSLPRLVPPLGRVARQQIDGVKRSFRRYKLCLEGSSPITPEIVADIESRSVMKPWDRLAIVANCCKYSTRLNTVSLKQKSHSLSLSILAMCLLNGEIIDNHEDRGAAASADMTTSRWYKEQKFSGFKAPTGCLWPTTFIKSCRFTSVSLQADGIATKGHVWEISGKRITAASFDLTRSHAEEPLVEGHLNDHHRESLGQLVDRLNWGRHHRLANYLDEYLAKEARRRRQATPAEKYMLVMARELATAMVEGKSLRLGRLRSEGDQAPCRAIFITEKQHNFVAFTSFSAAEPITGHHDANDLDCHVSLSVAEDPPILSRQLPRLRVNGWVHSLCFFQGCNPTKVVFPWPKSLLDSEL